MFKSLVVILLTIGLAMSVLACQSPTATQTSTPQPSTGTTTMASTSQTTVTATVTQTPTTTLTATTTPANTTTTTTVTTTPAAPNLPVMVSLASDKTGSELQAVEFAKVTAVFLFDTRQDPGYYYISLLSNSDNFGAQTIEWYRATKQIALTWQVFAGHDAYYRLKNNEPVSSVFKTQISYSKYVSLSTVPRDTASDLEREIADRINLERKSRALPLLVWDDGLYKQALQTLTAIGQEGLITVQSANQTIMQTAYVSTGGIGQDAISVFQSWIVSETYSGIMLSPDVKSFAIRTDIYDNHKFYTVGLFKK